MLTINEVRASIATNVLRSRELRTAANAVRGIERHNLHNERRRLGADTRCRLLILAFLRGRPYLTVEPSCRQPPNVEIAARILDNGGSHDDFMAAYKRLEAWIAVRDPVQAVAA